MGRGQPERKRGGGGVVGKLATTGLGPPCVHSCSVWQRASQHASLAVEARAGGWAASPTHVNVTRMPTGRAGPVLGWLAGWLYWLASLLVGRLGWLHGGLVWKRATLARLAGWLAGWLGGGASTKVGRGLFESHLDGCWPSRGG